MNIHNWAYANAWPWAKILVNPKLSSMARVVATFGTHGSPTKHMVPHTIVHFQKTYIMGHFTLHDPLHKMLLSVLLQILLMICFEPSLPCLLTILWLRKIPNKLCSFISICSIGWFLSATYTCCTTLISYSLRPAGRSKPNHKSRIR